MARTKSSGWGGGVMKYQVCPLCGKKKALYDPIPDCGSYHEFKCTWCKERFNSTTLYRTASVSVYERMVEEDKNKIVLKKKYLEVFEWKRKLKSIESLSDEERMNCLNESLDMLTYLNNMRMKLNGDGDLVTITDYENYLDLLAEENYEELIKYKII